MVALAITMGAAILLILALQQMLNRPSEVAGTSPPAAATILVERQVAGVAACSTTGCHGAIERQHDAPIWGTEFRIWLEQDRHSQSYAVLSSPQSLRIATRLGRITKPVDDGWCLNCHAPRRDFGRHPVATMVIDGVDCESCHGAAHQWLALHQQPAWRDMSPAEKAAHGMRDTKNLVVQAELCASCHVGGPAGQAEGRDVNHDLIAAGHPPLRFELATYLDHLPRHWDEAAEASSDATDDPVRQGRIWAIGQAVSAAAALSLLSNRAGSNKPWPELAEFDCAACHHDLTANSWRKSETERLGQLRWGTWNYAMLPLLRDSQAAVFPPQIPSDLEALRNSMRNLGGENRREIAESAAALSLALQEWAATCNESDFRPSRLRETVFEELAGDSAAVTLDWESAVQCLLMLERLDSPFPDEPSRQRWLAVRKLLEEQSRFEPESFRAQAAAAGATGNAADKSHD